MNRREFMRDGTMALMAMGLPGAFAFESGDEESEKALSVKILAWIEKVNPIDPKTGRRKFISLAYVSDTHKCKRVPGDADPVNPVTDFWYWGKTLCDPEPSIRLIGAVAKTARFDGVIHAGDFSTGKTPKAFSPGDYLGVMRDVKGLFDRHLPTTPFFAVGGKNVRLVLVSLYDQGCEKDVGLRLKEGLKADKIGVANTYCRYGTKTVEAYRFSLFVFDTEANKVHELRLSGGNKKYNRPNRPQELAHEIDIG